LEAKHNQTLDVLENLNKRLEAQDEEIGILKEKLEKQEADHKQAVS